MRIPKYVERLIQRRERLAWELMEVGADLDAWLEKKQCIDRNRIYSNWLYDILRAEYSGKTCKGRHIEKGVEQNDK